jgi:hypothetical protein
MAIAGPGCWHWVGLLRIAFELWECILPVRQKLVPSLRGLRHLANGQGSIGTRRVRYGNIGTEWFCHWECHVRCCHCGLSRVSTTEPVALAIEGMAFEKRFYLDFKELVASTRRRICPNLRRMKGKHFMGQKLHTLFEPADFPPPEISTNQTMNA